MATLHQIAAEQPHTLVNIEAEALLLGALLIESSLFAQIADTITADDFAEGVHARIFAAIARMVGQGKAVTAVLLRPEFENDEGLRDLGGVTYLAQLTLDGMQGLLAGREIAEQIHDLAQRRRMVAALDDIRARCHDAASGELPDIAALLEASPKPAGQFTVFDAGDFEGHRVTPREWMMEGWEPKRSCVYLTGQGAVGKSLFTQQRMTCAAAGIPFLGVPVEPGVAIYVTCEDDLGEMHRRQDSINIALGVSWESLKRRLFLISLKGLLNKELCLFDSEDKMRTTERWTALNATIDHLGATHVALDNVAHFFTGNENVRNHVAAFTGLIDGMAERINGVVMLLGHPNKSGDEYSGSTAWENQVRARIFLGMDKAPDGSIADPDARILTNSKPNYSKRGEAINFRWHDWAFVREEDLPRDRYGELSAVIVANSENEAFLRCLRVRAGQAGREVGPKIGPSYAPSRFVEMSEAKGHDKRALARAMERLLAGGSIVTEELFNAKSRRHFIVIREVI